MRLADCSVSEDAGRRRSTGTVLFADGSHEEYWFDVPAGAHHRDTGDPWAIALLPLAMARGESLEIPLPVNPVLLRNLEILQSIWKAWHAPLTVVEVAAPTASVSTPAERRVVSCFSGGVDSFYTLIRNHARFPPGHPRRISGLMLVHGADVPVDDAVTFGALRERYGAVAAGFGVVLLDARTNFRSGSLGRLSWSDLTHAACLAACASALGNDVECLLIPSGAPHRAALRAWGSTPLTDPLFASSRLRVEHDGAELSRPEKVQYLSSHPVVRSHLRVCWRSKTDQNCGRCAKCLRTMAILDAIGQLDGFSVFPRDTYSSATLSKVFCRSPSEYLQLRLVHGLALIHGRNDLARAVSRALGRSDALHAARTVVGFVEGAFRFRRLGSILDRRIQSTSILD